MLRCLGVVPGTILGGPSDERYRIERVLALSTHCSTVVCESEGRLLVMQLSAVVSAADVASARRCGPTLMANVHPRIPRLRRHFLVRSRASAPALAAFVFDEPIGIPLCVLLQRLIASSPRTRLMVVLEASRQLFELSAAAEIAGLVVAEAKSSQLERIFVGGSGVYVTPFGVGGAWPAVDGYRGALTVREVASCAVRLLERFVPRPPSGYSKEAVERLYVLSRSTSPVPPARDLLTWIYPFVARYDRQRFAELAERVQRAAETAPTLQLDAVRRESLTGLALQSRAIKRTPSPSAAAVADAVPEPRSRSHPRRSRLLPSLATAIAVLVVGGGFSGARPTRSTRAVPDAMRSRRAAHSQVLARYASAASKDERSTICAECIDLTDLARGRRVFVDGLLFGETPLVLELPCGAHQLRVGSRASYKRVEVPCPAGGRD